MTSHYLYLSNVCTSTRYASYYKQHQPPNSSGDDISSILTATDLDTASNPTCCGLTEIWRVRKRRARERRHITDLDALLAILPPAVD